MASMTAEGRATVAVVLSTIALLICIIANTGLLLLTARINEEKHNRAIQVNTFLEAQCNRDALRDAVIVQALEDAKRRAQASLGGQEEIDAVAAIQASINQLEIFGGNCTSQIPEPQ